jgi:TonB family protein
MSLCRAVALAAIAFIVAIPAAPRAQDAPPPAGQTPTPAPTPDTAPQEVYTPSQARLSPPRIVSTVKPGYTAEAVRARIQGSVRLRAVVESDGTVSNVEVLNSLDKMYGLDQAAIDALKQWRFEPGTLESRPVRVQIAVELTFTLRDTPIRQAWPEGFLAASPPGETRDEQAEAQGLRVTVARPTTWTRRSSPPAEWLGLRSPDGHALLSVLPPADAGFELQSPAPDALVARVAESVRRSQPNAETLALGQIQAANLFWVWSSLHVPPAPPAAGTPPEAGPLEARTWAFMTTVRGKVVGLYCVVLIPPGVEGAELEARVQKAAAEFAPIVNSIKIEAVP